MEARQEEGTAQGATSMSSSSAQALPGGQPGGGPEQHAQGFDSIESALEAVANGEFVVVLDDEDRENEGDLIIAAEKVLKATSQIHQGKLFGQKAEGVSSADCG